MPESSIDVVRRGFEAFREGGFERLYELCDPAIEAYAAPGLINVGTHHGIEAVRRWTREWDEAWGEHSYEPVELTAVDEYNVLGVVRMEARGRESGTEVTATLFWLLKVRDGKLTGWRMYRDRESALTAARARAASTDA